MSPLPALPGRRARVAVLGAVAGVVALVGTALGTWSAFTDTDPADGGTTGAATVVLGGRAAPPALAFTGLRAGSTTTLPLTVDYRGSVPATITLAVPSTSSTSCTRTGVALLDGALVGSLTVTLGGRSAESWCSVTDGAPRTVLATLAPRTTTTVPVTVTVGSVVLAARTEQAVLRVSSAGGFTDQVAGSIRITTSTAVAGRAAARVAAPVVAGSPSAITVPAECTAAGRTSFSEVITLTQANRSFDAARDRPGSAGPFLVFGSDGDDTVTGSAGGDCVASGAGADVVDGAGGDDVLVGGDGDDRLGGGDGADRLFGGAGADTLTGGPGADTLDGGPDANTCPDAGPDDVVTLCTVPAPVLPAAPAVPAPTAAQEGAADPPTTTAPPEPATPAPVPAPETAATTG